MADLPDARPRIASTCVGTRCAPVRRNDADAPTRGRSIREEIEALERASRALSRGQCVTARKALAEYRRLFPNGELEREADVVEVEILGRSEGPARARLAAQRFAARFPDSPYALRLAPWLDTAAKDSTVSVPSCAERE